MYPFPSMMCAGRGVAQYIGSASGSLVANGGALSLSLSALGAQVDDLAIVFVSNAGGGISAPSGWSTDLQTWTATAHTGLAWKLLTATDLNPSFTWPSADTNGAYIALIYRNANSLVVRPLVQAGGSFNPTVTTSWTPAGNSAGLLGIDVVASASPSCTGFTSPSPGNAVRQASFATSYAPGAADYLQPYPGGSVTFGSGQTAAPWILLPIELVS